MKKSWQVSSWVYSEDELDTATNNMHTLLDYELNATMEFKKAAHRTQTLSKTFTSGKENLT